MTKRPQTKPMYAKKQPPADDRREAATLGVVARRVNELEKLLRRNNLGVLSAFPSAPYEGQIFKYQNTAMEALGLVWMFRYRGLNADGTANASSYPWELVSGNWYTATWTGSVSTSLTTWTDVMTLATPAIGAGDWMMQGSLLRFVNATAVHTVQMAMQIGAVQTTQAAWLDRNITAPGDARGSVSMPPQILTGVAASSTASVQIALTVATASATATQASLAIIPVRVAGA